MGLPKNFNNINQENRQKALDDLKWFVFYFDYELTDGYSDFLKTAYDWGHYPEPLGSYRVFIADEDKAFTLFGDYVNQLVKDNKIKSYKLSYKSCETGKCGVTAILN